MRRFTATLYQITGCRPWNRLPYERRSRQAAIANAPLAESNESQSHRHRRRASRIEPGIMRTTQRERRRVPRRKAIASHRQRVVVHAPHAPRLLARVTGKANDVRPGAAVEMPRADTPAADGLRVGARVRDGACTANPDADGIGRAVTERLEGDGGDAAGAEGCAGAACVAGGAEAGRGPADLGASRVVGGCAVLIVNVSTRVEHGSCGEWQLVHLRTRLCVELNQEKLVMLRAAGAVQPAGTEAEPLAAGAAEEATATLEAAFTVVLVVVAAALVAEEVVVVLAAAGLEIHARS